MLPTKEAALALLHEHVQDEYQRHHALMVATAMEGYATLYNEDPLLWYLTGLLHDIDYEEHPDTHPAPSLQWFKDWGYPPELIHAVEAHAYGYHSLRPLPPTGHPQQSPSASLQAAPAGATISALPRSVTTLPETKLAAALVATDELTGIFYAYRKMNPVPYGEMKASSIRKKFKDGTFAAKIDRTTIQLGCDKLGIPLDDHIANLIRFLAPLS
jgi:putative nucleotidyltransferase with HDIG domain